MLTFVIWWISIGVGFSLAYTFVYHHGIRSMVDHQIMFCTPDQAEYWINTRGRGLFADIIFFLVLTGVNAIFMYPVILKLLRDTSYYILKDSEED